MHYQCIWVVSCKSELANTYAEKYLVARLLGHIIIGGRDLSSFPPASMCSIIRLPFMIHPDSKVHGANMGPISDRQVPGGFHVGHMNLAIWKCKVGPVLIQPKTSPYNTTQPKKSVKIVWIFHDIKYNTPCSTVGTSYSLCFRSRKIVREIISDCCEFS